MWYAGEDADELERELTKEDKIESNTNQNDKQKKWAYQSGLCNICEECLLKYWGRMCSCEEIFSSECDILIYFSRNKDFSLN